MSSPTHLRLANKLRAKIAPKVDGPAVMFWAVVSAVNTTAHTVTITRGTTTAIPGVHYDKSYTPTVGDTVWGLSVGGDQLVCGVIA